MRLGELLVGWGLATPEQIEEALVQQNMMGGRLGETLGNMIQQGLGGSGRSRSRSIPPIGGTPDAQTTQPQPAAPPSAEAQGDNRSQPASQDSQPMNDVLRQLFNRSQN